MDDFEKLQRDLIEMAKEINGGKSAKKFLKKAGKQLKEETIKIANSRVKKYTGTYIKSIKSGKVFKTEEGDIVTRAYSYSPHAHLIEHGHTIKTKTGEEIGFKKGYHVFSQAAKNYEKQYTKEIENFLDELIEEG